MKKIVQVAAAVITRPDGQFLLGQRGPDTVYSGYWEFPGGKVETGETPRMALIRELDEELGIAVQTCHPWLVREHVYEHAHVILHFFAVTQWRGEPRLNVHSAMRWQRADQLAVSPMLPANGPILKALRLPRIMGITHAGEIGENDQYARLNHALDQGLRLVQVREPALDAQAQTRFAKTVSDRCAQTGALCLINTNVALATKASGLHLPARVLMQTPARPDVEWVGASCHTRAELEHAAQLGLDYAVLGNIKATASHPDRAGLGWSAFEQLTTGLPLPVFAIGGLRDTDLPEACSHGAHGIAMIRGAWA
jgi:8-oxo-dGTP diphosphatase